MSANYNARNATIAEMTNKGIESFVNDKDNSLFNEAYKMEILPKPNFLTLYATLSTQATHNNTQQ